MRLRRSIASIPKPPGPAPGPPHAKAAATARKVTDRGQTVRVNASQVSTKCHPSYDLRTGTVSKVLSRWWRTPKRETGLAESIRLAWSHLARRMPLTGGGCRLSASPCLSGATHSLGQGQIERQQRVMGALEALAACQERRRGKLSLKCDGTLAV